MRFGLKKKEHVELEDELLENNKKLKEDIEKDGGLDKHDTFAMIISAYIVIIPVVVLALVVLLGLGYLLFT